MHSKTLILMILATFAAITFAIPAPSHGSFHPEVVDRVKVQSNQIICTPDERSSPYLAAVDIGLKIAFDAGNDRNLRCATAPGATTAYCHLWRATQPWFDMRLVFGLVPPADKNFMNYKRFVYEVESIRDVCRSGYRTGQTDANGDLVLKWVVSGIKLAKIWVSLDNTLEDRYAWIVLRGLSEPGYSIEGATGLTHGKFGSLKFIKPVYLYKGAVGVRASPDPNPPSPVRNGTTAVEGKYTDTHTDDGTIRDDHNKTLTNIVDYHNMNLTDTLEFELPPGGRMMTAED